MGCSPGRTQPKHLRSTWDPQDPGLQPDQGQGTEGGLSFTEFPSDVALKWGTIQTRPLSGKTCQWELPDH